MFLLEGTVDTNRTCYSCRHLIFDSENELALCCDSRIHSHCYATKTKNTAYRLAVDKLIRKVNKSNNNYYCEYYVHILDSAPEDIKEIYHLGVLI